MNSSFFKKLLIHNLPLRPSKGFLFDQLEKKLLDIGGEVGVDAASAGFKNRRMFKTKYYYGLDINKEALVKGLIKQGDSETFGILADMSRLDVLPSDSIDVLVSTNTLYCLDKENRIAAVKHLCRLTAPEGYFFCEIPASEEYDYKNILTILKDNFGKVKIKYYCNLISRAYENIFEKNGWLGTHPIAGLKLFRIFAWLIGRLEYLTCKFPSPQKHAFIICRAKKNPGARREFNLNGLPKIEEQIYNLMD